MEKLQNLQIVEPRRIVIRCSRQYIKDFHKKLKKHAREHQLYLSNLPNNYIYNENELPGKSI
jgi:hypothetical protein